MEALFGRAWFGLGDLDMATHLYRTKRLQEGVSLSKVTRELAQAHGIKNSLLPATDALTPRRQNELAEQLMGAIEVSLKTRKECFFGAS